MQWLLAKTPLLLILLEVLKQLCKNFGARASENWYAFWARIYERVVALVDPRFVAFKETLKDLDLYHQEWVVEAAFSVEEGYQAMKDFIEEADTRPTAFRCK